MLQEGAPSCTIWAHHKPSNALHDPPSSLKCHSLLKRVPNCETKLANGEGIGPNKLVLCVGSRVRYTSNTCPIKGLFQGSIGTVLGFAFKQNQCKPNMVTMQHHFLLFFQLLDIYIVSNQCFIILLCIQSMKEAANRNWPTPIVFVQFDVAVAVAEAEYVEAKKENREVDHANFLFESAWKSHDGVVAIGGEPMFSNLGNYIRFMPHLVLAHGLTFHKAQGQNAKFGAVVKPPTIPSNGKGPQMGMAYVGISRVCHLIGKTGLILLDPLFSKHFTGEPLQRSLVEEEYNRLRRLPSSTFHCSTASKRQSQRPHMPSKRHCP